MSIPTRCPGCACILQAPSSAVGRSGGGRHAGPHGDPRPRGPDVAESVQRAEELRRVLGGQDAPSCGVAPTEVVSSRTTPRISGHFTAWIVDSATPGSVASGAR